MGRALLLTGRPGVGKTTIIKSVIAQTSTPTGGFYTEEIQGPGGRKGFRLVTLDGREAVMAHVDLRGRGRPQVGRYGVDVDVIDRVGVAALRQALERHQTVIVDEIGRMELLCGPFRDVVLMTMGSPTAVVATAMSKPNPWVDSLKALPHVEVWDVTVRNRDEIAPRVVEWLER